MKKTACLILFVFLLGFSAVSAQTVETLSMTNLGDYFTWSHYDVEIMAILANINLADSSFTWQISPIDVLGTMFVANYQDDTGTYVYTLIADKETGQLKCVECTYNLYNSSMIIPTMEKIRDNYGLAQASPYQGTELSYITNLFENALMVTNDTTICMLAYSSATSESTGLVDLTFWNRAYYN